MLAKPRHPWVRSALSLQAQVEPPDATFSCLEIDEQEQQTASHLLLFRQCASSLSHGTSDVFANHSRRYGVHEGACSTLSPRFLRVNNPPNKHTDIPTQRIRNRHHFHHDPWPTTLASNGDTRFIMFSWITGPRITNVIEDLQPGTSHCVTRLLRFANSTRKQLRVHFYRTSRDAGPSVRCQGF